MDGISFGPTQGNLWSGYNGTDVNTNGIGDTPYIVFEDYKDSYLLMKPFGIEAEPTPSPSPSPSPTTAPTAPSTPTQTPKPADTLKSTSPSPSTISGQQPAPSPNAPAAFSAEIAYSLVALGVSVIVSSLGILIFKRRKEAQEFRIVE